MTKYTQDIQDIYIPDHRVKMSDILDELLYVTNTTCCHNDNCELEIDKRNAIYEKISWLDCYFCSEHCQSYGSWSIRYDLRRNRIAQSTIYNNI